MGDHHARRVAYHLQHGTTPQQLRSTAMERRSHGLHRAADSTLDASDARVDDAVGLLLPGCVLGGWAALRLQGNTFFDGRTVDGLRPALVHCLPGTQLRHREIIQPFRGLTYPEEILHLDGIAMTTPARAAFDEARMARSLDEAVVVMEMAMSTTHGLPHASRAAVRAVVGSHHKVRGIVRAQKAERAATSRSASPWETRTRLLAGEAGITGLLVNVPVFNLDGELLGVVDLLDPTTGLVIESDGGHHRELETHTEDNRREERLEVHGCVVARVTVLDHRHRLDTIARLAAAQRRARESTRRSWTLDQPAWWDTWPGSHRWR